MKKFISIILTISMVFIFCLAINAEVDESTLMSREFVYAGKGWNEAVAKTETEIRYDKYGKEYTGWTKTESGKRYYYKNGVRFTGVHKFKSGAMYVFTQNGLYLGKRNAGQYTVDFGSGRNVNINDGKITFTISGFKGNITSGDPFFSLYTYIDGKWKQIPYNASVFNDYALGTNNDIMTFSQPLSMFYCDFKPGLYRVKATVWEGERYENEEAIDKAIYAEFNIVETSKKKQLEKAPKLELTLIKNEETEQQLQAVQLTTSWSYTDESGNSGGYEADSSHALQLSDYSDYTLQLHDVNGKVLFNFDDNYSPQSISVQRWNVIYYTGNQFVEDSKSKSEPVEVIGNVIYIKNDKNDYIYEVYAKWEQGSSWYAFQINSLS